MKRNYQVYKRHHNGKFIGWEIGYEKKKENKKGASCEVVAVATFYNPRAKQNAHETFNMLKFDQE